MPPDTDTELRRGEEAQDALESQADELEKRIGELGDDIDEAKKGLVARKEDADDDADDDDGDDPLAFDDPEANEDDEDEDDSDD